MPRGRGASRYGPGGGRDWGERPSVDGPTPLLRQGGYPGHEVLAVDVVHEDAAALQALHHHMVEGIRGIQAGLARHDRADATRSVQIMQHPRLFG